MFSCCEPINDSDFCWSASSFLPHLLHELMAVPAHNSAEHTLMVSIIRKFFLFIMLCFYRVVFFANLNKNSELQDKRDNKHLLNSYNLLIS